MSLPFRAGVASVHLFFYVNCVNVAWASAMTGAGTVTNRCPPMLARLADSTSDNETYIPFSTLQPTLDALHRKTHPIVLVAVNNVPCARGCCTINLSIRPGTTDSAVLQQVIIGDEFGFLNDLKDFRPTSILDAGGNIGMTSVLFALHYPEAKIVVVEPSSGNFRLLESNTARYGNIRREKHGLWSKNAPLTITKDGDSTMVRVPGRIPGHWAFQVKESTEDESDLMGVNLELLMSKHDISKWDMVKVDIEGSEKEVFENYRNPATGAIRKWIRDSKLVIAETHDDIVPGALKAVETAMKARGGAFTKTISGELHIWRFLG